MPRSLAIEGGSEREVERARTAAGFSQWATVVDTATRNVSLTVIKQFRQRGDPVRGTSALVLPRHRPHRPRLSARPTRGPLQVPPKPFSSFVSVDSDGGRSMYDIYQEMIL